MSLREQVVTYLKQSKLGLNDAAVGDRASLFDSGVLDSQGLFDLAMWIEQQVGRSLDLAQLDPRRDWANVDAIVGFIERQRG